MPSPATQRLVVRKLLSLPPPVLRLMSGGGVVYQGGRTLDPRFQFLAAQAKANPPMASLTPEQARAANTMGLAAVGGEIEPGVTTEALTIDGPGGPIPLRAYRAA